MCSELCKDFYVVYQLEMVAGEVESSCQLVVTFFFFGLTLPNYRNKSGSAQRSPPSYQLLPPPLVSDLIDFKSFSFSYPYGTIVIVIFKRESTQLVSGALKTT